MEKEAQATAEKAEAWSRVAAASAEVAAARDHAKRSSVGVSLLTAELKDRDANTAQMVREYQLRRMKLLVRVNAHLFIFSRLDRGRSFAQGVDMKCMNPRLRREMLVEMSWVIRFTQISRDAQRTVINVHHSPPFHPESYLAFVGSETGPLCSVDGAVFACTPRRSARPKGHRQPQLQ